MEPTAMTIPLPHEETGRKQLLTRPVEVSGFEMT